MPRGFRHIAANGKAFGRWTVIDDLRPLWIVRCECGATKEVRRDFIIRRLSKGCMSCVQKSHGMEGSRIYNIWAGMKQRCSNPDSHAYARYGGRGIRVCDRWQDFAPFLADMGEAPRGKTLGRIDNDGPYSRENCRWETPKQQSRNRWNTAFVVWRGEKRAVADVADECGMPLVLVRNRLAVGWSIEKAVTIPSRKS